MAIPFARLGIPAPLRRSVDPGAPKSAKVAVAKLAREPLVSLPVDQILSGLRQRTFPKILEFIAEFRTASQILDDRIVHIREATTRTVVRIARRAGADLCEVICRHQERLLLSPDVFVALHANPHCADEDLGRAEAFLRMHKSLPEVAEHRPFREPEPPAAPAEPEVVAEPEAPAPLTPPPAQAADPQPVALQPAQQSAEKLAMFDLDDHGKDADGLEAFKFDFQDEMDDFSWDLTGDEDGDSADDEPLQFQSIERRIADMTVGEKIKLAYLGNKQARNVLVRDPNKIVASAVVKSGRLTPSEVASYAGNRNLADDVVREIAGNKDFTRKYPVKVALVNNPKTPVSVAINFISHLHKRDLQALANNRNVSSVIFTAAKKAFKSKYRK